jgi:hypothetical protein
VFSFGWWRKKGGKKKEIQGTPLIDVYFQCDLVRSHLREQAVPGSPLEAL